ncbi:hypothetical protein ACFY1L_43555 [Streptomyces sp. NPDC001663]|uniref:hypothetical protein n=1 Tax=Streptomyces sp. NPDC001663 TaxID=3364597 RepID=UPI003699AEE9
MRADSPAVVDRAAARDAGCRVRIAGDGRPSEEAGAFGGAAETAADRVADVRERLLLPSRARAVTT